MRSHDLNRLLDEPGRGAWALAPQKISIWRLSWRNAVSGVRQPGKRFEVRRCGGGRPFRAPSARRCPDWWRATASACGRRSPVDAEEGDAYTVRALPVAGTGSGVPGQESGGSRVLRMLITAPQQAHSTGARWRIVAGSAGGVNFNNTCSSAIRRLEFGCRKPKLRARRKPFGNTCCKMSHRKCAPQTVRRSIRPVLASR